MKQLTILSGKGGTGKTTLTASFSILAKNAVVADCDVDAPDLHMLLHPEVMEMQQFKGSKIAVIDENKCARCGLCREKCAFAAVTSDLKVDAIACEGCGVCAVACPANAITLVERVSGSAYISKTKYGFMSHAMLYPGESNSGKLVTLVRQNAKILAEKEDINLILIDGSPGIGCPVIASITGVDAGLVVTEPTLSGIHDLERALQLLNHFRVTPFVCINMYDINVVNTESIVSFCRKNCIEVVGKIPFSPKVTEAMVNGKTIMEYSPKSAVAKEIEVIWKKVVKLMFDN
ncbi:(4Fe-4S)-binding protein [Candidatus Bathyarchaeota archaeon A05DMB-2]|jgi:MinD superfamily P-loop ATPase|nr:(4Fe-4S)-binding protein [Candidatus Bathyarchaeota archaeon A05DMB-2]